MEERLQKIIAHAGITSRRKAEELIEARQVTVNGKIATIGDKADPAKDDIRVQGKRLHAPEKMRYLIMNKGRGIVSTTDDPEGRKTVIDMLGKGVSERVYPVGRLDIDSDGLVLLTNDGDLTHHVSHPRFGCEKTYKVLVEGRPPEPVLNKWRRGIMLEDGQTAPCKIKVLSTERKSTWLRIVMGEGKKRQIRRVAEQLGCPVMRLTRTHIGPVALGNLKSGQTRELSPLEVKSLMKIQPTPQKPKKKR
jgi:pseudouridine synthase